MYTHNIYYNYKMRIRCRQCSTRASTVLREQNYECTQLHLKSRAPLIFTAAAS